ncbi:hypothetical protein DRJ16_01975 [Candidatus Woesearchaeota archaeon]|nr:MAG: hypothetical protein DRJ16_01975 [Candidatus Woesearchaeota archaeon]
MRIEKVRIRNFRSIIDTGEISLDEKITLLLGKNEQGKTNFLKALESFGKEYKYEDYDLSYLMTYEKEPQQIPIITIWFKLNDDEKKILSSVSEEFEKQPEVVITRYFDGHYEIEKPDLGKIRSKINEVKLSILKIIKENKNKIEESIDFLNQIDKEKHINWLRTLQRPDGGFSHQPGPGQLSHITHTYYAVKALLKLGGLNRIDKNKLLQFILSCQHPNGGFGHSPNQPPQTQFTYHAIMLLKELGALNQIDKNKHINWLKSIQRPDGGFSHQPGQASHITNTYFAIKALAELGALNQIDKKKVVDFIISCQNPNGGFGHLPNQQPYPQYTYNAIFLLKKFGDLDKIELQKHISWLKSLQRHDGGFWSGTAQEQSQMNPTYFATKTLMELGVLNQINVSKLIEFILSLQHQNGGFKNTQGQQPHVQFTYQGIMLLGELQAYFSELFEKYLQELERTSDPVEVDKLVKGILSIVPDEKMVNLIKKEVEKLKSLKSDALEKKILELIPNFVYFDSVDIIGDYVSLNEYLENKEKYKTFKNLFRLANLDVERVKNISNPHGRKLLFRNASAKITGMINEFWKQEKVNVNLDIDGDKILVFVEDEYGAKADPPSKRSDGFRWFLSFYINFMAGTKGELKNAVLLLDNPGWVLHPSGQKNLLDALEEIAETNQIVISTHSPFLIDKNKLERIRIVKREANVGTKVYEKFWDSPYDSLQQIRVAIGADISDSLFGHKNNIVVEGYSDKVYLETMNEYLKRKKKETIDTNKVTIIGAGGADKILYLVAWLNAEKYNSLALLDADNEGRKVIQEIENRNIEINKDSDILILNEISDDFKGKDMEIEDLIDEEFYNMAVNKAYRDIFESKLGKPEVKLEEIPTNGLRTKRYSKFFKNNNLGGFDKVKVALKIKKILSGRISKEEEEMLEETVHNFGMLFKSIKEKFEKKGTKL